MPVKENSFPLYTTILTGVGLVASAGAAVAVAPIAIPAIIGGFGAIGITLGTTAIATTGIIFFGTTIAIGTAVGAFAGMSIDAIKKDKSRESEKKSGSEPQATENLAEQASPGLEKKAEASPVTPTVAKKASASVTIQKSTEPLTDEEKKIFDLALTSYKMKLVRKICRSLEKDDQSTEEDDQSIQKIQQVFTATKSLNEKEKKQILNWFTSGEENDINGQSLDTNPINLGLGDSPNSNNLSTKKIIEIKKKYKLLLESDLSKKHFLYIEEFCQNIITQESVDNAKKINTLKQVASTALNDDTIYQNNDYRTHLEATINSTNLSELSLEAKAKIKTQSSSFLTLDSFGGVSFFSELTRIHPGTHLESPRKDNGKHNQPMP
jgi:hypothetical protein